MKRVFCWLFVFAIVCVAVAFPSLALAETSESSSSVSPVTVEPLVDFGGVFDSLKGVVTNVVVGAVAIGLGIWATRFIFHLVKSMGRG